jgi:hypothetical protein
MRDQILSSGTPIMIAGVSFGVLAYLAIHRRERFLVYWTVAWAALLWRFVWNTIWGSPFPTELISTVAAFLRLAFAGAVMAGVLELRGRHVRHGIVSASVVLFLVIKDGVLRTPPQLSQDINMVVMAALLIYAAWQLSTYTALPRFERAVTSGALAAYALFSASGPSIDAASELYRYTTIGAWTCQLLVTTGMLATYFRVSYEAELRAQRHMGYSLTEALSGFVPICMHCKSIKDEKAEWRPLEEYVASRSETVFSHGLCPNCAKTHCDFDDSK